MTTRRSIFAALLGALVVGIAEAKGSHSGGGKSFRGGGKRSGASSSGGSGGCGSRGGAGYRKANGKCAGKNE